MMPPPRSADDEAAAEARELLAATGFGPAEIAVVEGQYRQNSIAFTAQSLRAHDLEDLLREARRLAGGAELVCTLAHISPKGEKHGSDMAVNPKTGRLKNPVQRAPFKKAGKGGKWIVMQTPPAPLCESCTSTIRKHYTGVTTSPQICAGFTRLIDQYKCLMCETWHPGELAVSRGNMWCPSCGWVAGNKNARKQPGGAKRKPKPRPAPPPPPLQEPEPEPAPLPPGLPSMESTGFTVPSDDPFAPGAVAGFIPGAGAHRTAPDHGLGLDPDDLIKQLSKLSVDGLSPGELDGVLGWRDFYRKEDKYPAVGVLSGRYYDEAGGRRPGVLDELERTVAEWKEAEAATTAQFPPCNSKWTADASEVWCTSMSGGTERGWVGYPRKMHKRGSSPDESTCVCTEDANTFVSGDNLLEVYDGCDKLSARCAT